MRAPPPPGSRPRRPRIRARRRAKVQDPGRVLLGDLLAMVSPVVRAMWRSFILELGVDPVLLGAPGAGAGRRPRPVQDPAGDPHAVLQVSPRAPREVVEAAYRALAKLHHPDAGGDPERMKALTAAMDRIRTLRGWR